MSLEIPASSPRPVRPARTDRQQRCSCCGRAAVWEGPVGLLHPLEDQVAGMDEVVDIDSEEEAANLRHVSVPAPQPPAEEIEKHRVDHYPYRTWCQQCVQGRGVGMPHKTGGHQSTVAIVAVDYFFMTAEGLKKRDELEAELGKEDDAVLAAARTAGKIVKCVATRCLASKNTFAHVIPQKGDDEEHYCARLVAADVEWLGHTRVIIKTDNERAIVSLKQRVARMLRELKGLVNVQTESPVEYDSQSNGAIEAGIKIVRGMFRTLKLCLEARLGKYVPVNHALVPWLLEHTCILLNAKAKGPDGLTPWERTKGRLFGQPLLGFAECVLYKLPSKGPKSRPDGNMGARWLEGVFLGFSRSANSYIVHTAEGIATCRTLCRKTIEKRWSADQISQVTATPWAIRERPERRVALPDRPRQEEQTAKEAGVMMPKNFRINMQDLEEYGFTPGCEQCSHNEEFGRSRDGHSHTAECRARFMDKFMATAKGRARLEAYERRVDRALADRQDVTRADTTVQRDPTDLTGADVERVAFRDILPGGAASGMSGGSSSSGLQGPRPPSSTEAQTTPPEPAPALAPAPTPEDYTTMEGYDPPGPNAGDVDMGLGRLADDASDEVSNLILEHLGFTGRSHERERRSAFRHVVSEIYSPPRVTLELMRGRFKHLSPGLAFDLTVNDPDDGKPWDFSRASKRAKARELIKQTRPMLLIGSPMCTRFSTWQRLNDAKAQNPDLIRKAHAEACAHIEFVVELYREQLAGNRYFLHEHPRFASSWDLECMQLLSSVPGVRTVRADQCQYGAEVPRGALKGSPVMKPTGFMSNSESCCELYRRGASPARVGRAAARKADAMWPVRAGSARTWRNTRANSARLSCEDLQPSSKPMDGSQKAVTGSSRLKRSKTCRSTCTAPPKVIPAASKTTSQDRCCATTWSSRRVPRNSSSLSIKECGSRCHGRRPTSAPAVHPLASDGWT